MRPLLLFRDEEEQMEYLSFFGRRDTYLSRDLTEEAEVSNKSLLRDKLRLGEARYNNLVQFTSFGWSGTVISRLQNSR